VRKADNLAAILLKSVNVNFLEPSRPLQACNRTDLPLLFFIGITVSCVTRLAFTRSDN